mgnify:CR=1 FL=1
MLGNTCTINKVTHPRYNWRVSFKSEGKIRYRFFKLKKDAQDFVEEKNAELTKHGTGTDLSASDRATLAEFKDELDAYGLTLRNALSMAIEQARKDTQPGTVTDLIDDVIRGREDAGVASKTLEDYELRLRGKFGKDFGHRAIAGITAAELDEWIRARSQSAVTQLRYRQLIKTMFGRAVEKGIRPDNPAVVARRIATRRKRAELGGKIGILTPEQASSLLAACPDDIVTAVAIGLFAGIRTGSPKTDSDEGELLRLDWSAIDLGAGAITVAAEVSKTGYERLIPIQPNLAKWLAPHRQASGPILPANYYNKLRQARKDAGIKTWPHDAMRHSFVSYHYQAFKNIGELVLATGHQNPDMIHRHYKRRVSEEAATAFWSIAPAGETNVVSIAK